MTLKVGKGRLPAGSVALSPPGQRSWLCSRGSSAARSQLAAAWQTRSHRSGWTRGFQTRPYTEYCLASGLDERPREAGGITPELGPRLEQGAEAGTHSGDKGLCGVVYSGQVLRQEAVGWDALISVGPPPSLCLTLTLNNRGPHLSPSDGQ